METRTVVTQFPFWTEMETKTDFGWSLLVHQCVNFSCIARLLSQFVVSFKQSESAVDDKF